MLETNRKLARIFYEMADLLDLAGVEWKPQAYRRAAAALEGLEEDVREIYKKGGLKALDSIEGVGQRIAKKIEQYIKTGKIKQYEKLKGATKSGLREIINVTSLGPKKAMRLYQELGIKNLASLERAAKQGKIRNLPGFGEKSEQDILEGIKLYKARGPRKPYAEAKKIADEVISELKNSGYAGRIVVAGSIRRKRKTIGDIDILATSKQPGKLIDAFTKLPQVKRVLAKGPTKAMVILRNNMQADLRVVDEESYGAALLYFTGDKQFNIEMRKKAIKLGYKLSEYGLFDRQTGKKVAGKTEKEIFKILGYKRVIPPTARERN